MFNRILCWGAQFPPEHYPDFYTRRQRIAYWVTIRVWRVIYG